MSTRFAGSQVSPASRPKSEAQRQVVSVARKQIDPGIEEKGRVISPRYDQSRSNSPLVVDSTNASYIGDVIHVTSALFVDGWKGRRAAVIGGQIVVQNQLWDVTVGHIFLRDRTANDGHAKQEQLPSKSSDAGVFSIDTDSEEDELQALGRATTISESNAVEPPPREEFETSVNITSGRDYFVLGDKLRIIPPLYGEGDWALLCSQNSPRRQSGNRIEKSGGATFIDRVDSLDRTRLLYVVIPGLFGKLTLPCRASASLSLICLPGSEKLQRAHSLEVLHGKSEVTYDELANCTPQVLAVVVIGSLTVTKVSGMGL